RLDIVAYHIGPGFFVLHTTAANSCSTSALAKRR
ncbi:MAG: hypothetical protein ACI822_003283, partial [Gammaproteobacteria bacterium]